jgi:hypothetical protein
MRTANRVLIWAAIVFFAFVTFLILDSYFDWNVLS